MPTMDDVEQLIYDQQVSAEESEDFEASEEIRKFKLSFRVVIFTPL